MGALVCAATAFSVEIVSGGAAGDASVEGGAASMGVSG
jgi:hypothetical protein